MPSCPSLWATMIWAGHPPTCVQWADEDTSGSRDRDKSNGKCILHHCNSCPISEFSVKDRAKFLQHCHRLLQGHMDTLEHQGRSEQEEGQCPTLCLDWIGSALEIFQCCSSFVLLKNRATELGASPLLAQPHGLWDPPSSLPSTMSCCGAACIPEISPWAAAHREERAPFSSVGAGLLAGGLFLPQREHEHFGKCKSAF